jgi:hypothetical protein
MAAAAPPDPAPAVAPAIDDVEELLFMDGKTSILRHQFLQPEKLAEFTCSICSFLFTNPVLLNNFSNECDGDPCGHLFCDVCITRALTEKKQCPICRQFTHDDDLVPDMNVRRKVATLNVYCRYRNIGCTWSGALGMNTRNYKDHIVTCAHRGQECKDCKEIVSWSHLRDHAASRCPEAKIACANVGCTDKILRKKMSEHTESKCRYRIVECEFKHLGSLECAMPMSFVDCERHWTNFMPMHLTMLAADKVLTMRKLELKTLALESETKAHLALCDEVDGLKKSLKTLKRKGAEFFNRHCWELKGWVQSDYSDRTSPTFYLAGHSWQMMMKRWPSEEGFGGAAFSFKCRSASLLNAFKVRILVALIKDEDDAFVDVTYDVEMRNGEQFHVDSHTFTRPREYNIMALAGNELRVGFAILAISPLPLAPLLIADAAPNRQKRARIENAIVVL